MKKYISMFVLGLMCFSFIQTPIGAKAESNNAALYDKNGAALQVDKKYYVHMIYNGWAGFYPWYDTTLVGWQNGYTQHLGPNPTEKNMVQLKARDKNSQDKRRGDFIGFNDKIAIEVINGLDTNTHRYWTMNKLNFGFPTSNKDRYLYLDTWGKSPWFKLKRLSGETYHGNRYNLGVLKEDNTYHSVGRQGEQSGNFVGQDNDLIRVVDNNDTKFEFIPLK